MAPPAFRPPAVPLIAIDPYFSVWSFADNLTTSPTRHWTGAPQPIGAFLRLDGSNYRVMGSWPAEVPAFRQLSVEVLPTRTIYIFEDAGVQLKLTFLTPALPEDLLRMSWPITYVTFDLMAQDGRDHEAEIYFELPAELAVDRPVQAVTALRAEVDDMEILRFGTPGQPVLERVGDDVRINWGYAYLVLPARQFSKSRIVVKDGARDKFLAGENWPADDFLDFPVSVAEAWPKLACATEKLKLNPGQPVSRFLVVAYDDVFSVEYHHRKLRPYWRARGMSPTELFRAAVREYEPIKIRCENFDRELMVDLVQAGGQEYAQVAALSFRQCLAAHKLCEDADGTLLYFSKENFSNGCIATVDVTYPSAPFFLLFNPKLLAAQLVPILDYASSQRWKFDFAPHDLGCYPLANGQVYGGAEASERDQMPVEECGNMIILVAALCQRTGDWSISTRYAPVLKKWAEYLLAKGLDPAEQLCTDDFAGHLARNANLSLKAIMGIRCYAQICRETGEAELGRSYLSKALEMLNSWQKMADSGDHYRLTFDLEPSWSQKYNLIWNKILDLDFIPRALIEKELTYYKSVEHKFGLPLDSRGSYAKLDWTVWTASMADDRETFDSLFRPLFRWVNETLSRVPLTDWYWTDSGVQAGFQARSVVGGLFVKLLLDKQASKKWTNRAR